MVHCEFNLGHFCGATGNLYKSLVAGGADLTLEPVIPSHKGFSPHSAIICMYQECAKQI